MLPILPDIRVRQRDLLLEISRALTEQLELDTVLVRILEAATEMLNGQAGLIALREEAGGFAVRAHYRVSPDFLSTFAGVLQDLDDSAGRGDPAQFLIAELERRLLIVARASRIDLSGTVGLSMTVGKELIGVILVFRAFATPLSFDDRRLLQSFADQAAIAVHNARLYRQVTQEKRRLDALMESAADGVMIMNAAHHIEKWNGALVRISGFSAAEAIGASHDDLIRWARREPGLGLAEAEAGGWPLSSGRRGQPKAPPIYVEGDLLRRDGSRVPVGVTYSALIGREGRLINIIGTVRDITKFREAEELKSTFISIISHELKTPVSLIKGYAGTLRREDARWDTRTVRESLAVIEEEADRLTDLIENLLDASRLQAGGLTLTMNEVPLDKLAARLVAKFRTQSEKHTITLDFPSPFPIIAADEDRLTQALSNLLSNAIKYSPEGGNIRVSGRVEPENVVISVSDEGPGLPADELPRVFDRFYRADTPATRRVAGAGLGLYLAKAVVEAHGGRIWAESEPGRGTTLSFSLPRQRKD